jgi:hypothetical protein
MKNDRLILVLSIALVVLAISVLKTCNDNSNLRSQVEYERSEQVRIKNNYEAAQDSIRVYTTKTGALVAQIEGYRLSQEELMNGYKDLFTSMKDFQEEWKKMPPKTIIEQHFTTVESVKDFQVSSVQNGQKGEISFSFDTLYSPNNSRRIKGNMKYNIAYFNKADSTLVVYDDLGNYAKVIPFSPHITIEQSMNLITGLSKDPKDGKIKIWATTDFPGVTFSKIVGAEVFDSEENRKLFAKSQKSWGLGFNLGPGLFYNQGKLVPGVVVGVGLNFTPKNLQFGK